MNRLFPVPYCPLATRDTTILPPQSQVLVPPAHSSASPHALQVTSKPTAMLFLATYNTLLSRAALRHGAKPQPSMLEITPGGGKHCWSPCTSSTEQVSPQHRTSSEDAASTHAYSEPISNHINSFSLHQTNPCTRESGQRQCLGCALGLSTLQ